MPEPDVVWLRHRTGVWHAWFPGEDRSICRLVSERPDVDADPELGERMCKLCVARIRGPGPGARPRGGRARRRRDAIHYAEAVASAPYACRCVAESEIARKHVATAEVHLAALLLAWEEEGTSVAARDVEDAERALSLAWKEAVRLYDRLDGRHPHDVRRGRP